jgi:beta-N-acetylhexosaminidase
MEIKLSIEQAIRQKLMLAFPGKDWPSTELTRFIKEHRPAGVTLYRSLNVENPAQVLELTWGLQQTAQKAGQPPLLIGVDQEGGQLMAIGEEITQLPGNLALGATSSVDLARQAGVVLGRELAAMGVNINYAPCCDVNINPLNPVVGTRSFGEDPQLVAGMCAAMVTGLQSCGVAATAKHFPGHGDTSSDSHDSIPVVLHDLQRLREVEFPPFAAAIRAGAKLVMTAHLALPAIAEGDALPATISPGILQGVLRRELGFDGVIVSDALDMGAILQRGSIEQLAVQAIAAGVDLLLLGPSQTAPAPIFDCLLESARMAELESDILLASTSRIQALKDWLAKQAPPPGLDVVGCAAHQAIADQIARKSVTLVRNQAGLLPLSPHAERNIAVIMPRPLDLTPADTSSYVIPALAGELRQYFPEVDEYLLPGVVRDQDIGALLEQVRHYRLAIVGTLNAFTRPDQARLVHAVLQTWIPCVVVALRMPYDLVAFPQAATYVCTYSILEPSMRALAQALTGITPFQGRLPVSIPGLYAAGAGITTAPVRSS